MPHLSADSHTPYLEVAVMQVYTYMYSVYSSSLCEQL